MMHQSHQGCGYFRLFIRAELRCLHARPVLVLHEGERSTHIYSGCAGSAKGKIFYKISSPAFMQDQNWSCMNAGGGDRYALSPLCPHTPLAMREGPHFPLHFRKRKRRGERDRFAIIPYGLRMECWGILGGERGGRQGKEARKSFLFSSPVPTLL